MPTEIYASVSVSKLYNERPDRIRQAVQLATIRGEDVEPHIVAANLQSITLGANRLLNYADISVNGLPEGTLTATPNLKDELHNVISAEIGLPIEILEHTDASAGIAYEYPIKQFLYSEYNWNSLHNIIYYNNTSGEFLGYVIDPTGTFATISYSLNGVATPLPNIILPVYSSGLHVKYTTTVYVPPFETTIPDLVTPKLNKLINKPAQEFTWSPNGATVTSYKLLIGNTQGGDNYHNSGVLLNTTLSTIVDLSNVTLGKIFVTLQVLEGGVWSDYYAEYHRYTLTPKYWYYNSTQGLHLTLSPSSLTTLTSEYYPITHLRNNGSFVTGSLEKDAKKALKFFQINYNDVKESLSENPDIGSIDDVFFNLAPNIKSTNTYTTKYFYLYFKYLAGLSSFTEVDTQNAAINSVFYNDGEGNSYTTVPYVWNVIAVEESEYYTQIKYNHISEEIVVGSIGNIGTTTSDESTYTYNYQKAHNSYNDQSQIVTTYTPATFTAPAYRFRHQVTATTYEEVLIVNLQGFDRVNHSWGPHYRYKKFLSGVSIGFFTGTATAENLTIPLCKTVLDTLSKREKEEVLYDSIVLTIYAIQVVHLAWYETGFFADLITFFAIVLAVYTAGQSLIAAGAIGGASAVALVALEILLISIVVDAVIDIILKNVEGVLGKVFAVIAAIYILYKTGQLKFDGMTLADKLLAVVDTVISVETNYLEHEMERIQQEYGEFSLESQERIEELEKAKEMYDRDPPFDALAILTRSRSNYSKYDTPEGFYHRSIHLGNIGVLSLQTPSIYTNNQLTLPREY